MNPCLVDVWRGNGIESQHRGAVSVVDSTGHSLLSLGDIESPIFARSSVKMLQALPLIESGAADAFGLDDRHIALACASHNAEPEHVQLVGEWLKHINCDADHLECGAHMPMGNTARRNLVSQGESPTRLHNNCSGKHAGLLSVCKHLGENTAGYRLYENAAQQRWFDVVESMSGTAVADMPWGYDGCGIPSLAMPMKSTALAFAKFSNATGVGADRAEAINRIKQALTAQPFLVAGSDRLCTDVMTKLAPQVFVKVGAEGFYTAMVPERGLGVAIKIDDGSLRGVEVVLGAVLQKLGVLDNDTAKDLQQYIAPPIKNSRGEVVGRAAPSAVWDSVALA